MKLIDDEVAEKINYYRAISLLKLSSDLSFEVFSKEEFNTPAQLSLEYDNIEKCFEVIKNSRCYARTLGILHQFRNITSSVERIENSITLDETELFEIKNFCYLCNSLLNVGMVTLKGVQVKKLNLPFSLLDIENSGTASFSIYDGYSEKLAKIRKEKALIESRIYKVSAKEREKLLIEFTRLSQLETDEELKVCKDLSEKLKKFNDEFKANLYAVAKIDILIAKAKLAIDYKMTRPKILDNNEIVIKNGYHPIVKYEVEKRQQKFYKITLNCKKGATVITGANMGGKTVALSTVALNFVFASMGFFAFAGEFRFCPSGNVSYISDTQGSVENGLSSFGTEVISLKKVLERLKENDGGLVIIDEFSRGTNPAEGSSLVKALVKYLNEKNTVSILSTHYDGVSKFANLHYEVRGLKNVDFSKFDIKSKHYSQYLSMIAEHMDYTIEKVEKDEVPKDAFNICSLFNIDDDILKNAKVFLKNNE